MGFHGPAAAHKPNISPVNAKLRLNWCKERRHWTVDNCKRVIWGDKSRLCGLVVRVPGYISRGPGFDSRR
jgi:hypothetical protein